MKRLLLALGTVLALALPGTAAADLPACTSTVSTAAAVQSAVTAAPSGSTVCLADGTYAKLALTGSKPVTVRAEHPGQATVAGFVLSGADITTSQFRLTGTWEARPGSSRMTVDRSFFDLNAFSGFGVMACASSSTQCNDVTVSGNRFVGQSEEDAIRANRYHDGDGDGRGLAIVNNEFTGNVEKGDHNDVFQAVWVGDHLVFSGNYLHDFGGQGFFVKDQATAVNGLVANDNLIVDQDSPCVPSTLCTGFQLSPFQVFGPVTNVEMKHNTVGFGRGGGFGVLTGSYSNAVFSDNVFDALGVTNSGGSGTVTTGSNNTRCTGNGWPAPTGTATDCTPAFLDAAHGDYRQANGRGVSWKVSDKTFGPSSAGPPPPPVDTDGDGVPDASDECPNQAGTQPNGCPPPDPTPDYQALYEAEKAKTADLTSQLAAMTTSRDNVQAIADAYKARAEAAEAKLAQIHTLSAP
jgi:hypothetical protein